MKYPCFIETTENNLCGGLVQFPTLAAADTREELLKLLGEQLFLEEEYYREEGLAMPEPYTTEQSQAYAEELEFEPGYEVVFVEPIPIDS